MPETIEKAAQNAADRYSGLTGVWKQVANFGNLAVTGVTVLGLIFWLIPKTQSEFHALIEREREANRNDIAKERQISRDDAEASRRHGDKAAETIKSAIDKNTDKMDTRHREMIDVLRRIESKGGSSFLPHFQEPAIPR